MTDKTRSPHEAAASGGPTGQKRPSLPQMMQQAAHLHSQGQLQQAELLLRQMLQRQPRHAHAWHLLGLIAHQVGNSDQALNLMGKAITLNDKVALFHANRGEMCRQDGRLESAVAHGKKAVLLEPRMATAHSNLGIAWFDKKEHAKAEQCQQSALKLDPFLPFALNNMGSIMRERHETAEAIDYYQRAAAADPFYAEPLNNHGAVLITEERYEDAVDVLSGALAIDQHYAEAHCNLGYALKALGRFDESFQHFQETLQINPESPEAYIGLGKIYQEKEQLADAEQVALKAIELDAENAEAYCLLGTLCSENDDPERALSCFDKALELNPKSGSALNGKGNLCMEIGGFTAAEELFKQILAVSPKDEMAARFHLVQAKKVSAGDENMAALVAMADHIASLPESKQTSLHFALGKGYDDLGDYEKAFAHFKEGCRLKREKIDYDPVAQDRTFDLVMDAFDRPALERLQSSGTPSELPVFILGMPRSGTTLTEQIIASHPAVHGAGEMKEMIRITNRSVEHGGENLAFPLNLKQLTPAIMTQWATDYLSALRQKNSVAQRITDKMPGNFMLLGLIRMMLPEARIIHVARNPVDTCLSCFIRLFQRGQEHTYDLTELGRYYRKYQQLMDYWHTLLPDESFLTVQYEDLVSDTEAQARRLVDYCGLEWDPACLDFHNNDRNIRTASVTQVRKPIYRTSVNRWRGYGAALDPLIEVLSVLEDQQ